MDRYGPQGPQVSLRDGLWWIGLAFSLPATVLGASNTAMTTASTTVTSVFLPGFDQQSLAASVITAAPTATTYFVQCQNEDEPNCGLGGGVTLTEGPSTFEINLNSTDMTISEACAISSDIASCTYSIAGGSSGMESASVQPYMYMNVTITAGFEALASAAELAAAEAAAKTAGVTASTSPTPTTSASSAYTTDNGMGSAAVKSTKGYFRTVLLMSCYATVVLAL